MMPARGEDEASAGIDDRFETFLKNATSDLPEDLRPKIVAGLRAKHASPPSEATAAVLRRSVSPERLRQLLYYPSEEDMQAYPQLISRAPEGAPEDHPQTKMQMHCLTALYLVHSRRWETVKPFIEAGGLQVLVDNLLHPNLYLRGQAFEVFVTIQQEELYPWHEPPEVPGGRSVSEGPDARVWGAMFSLTRSPLIANLVENATEPFPGAAFLALRSLAFFCSWIRHHFCKDRILRLSQQLLDVLEKWRTREGAIPEELDLAEKLYNDFSRFPPADAPDDSSVLGRLEETKLQELRGTSCPAVASPSTEVASEAADATGLAKEKDEQGGTGFDKSWVNPAGGLDVGNEADEAKARGNEAFKKQKWSAAVYHYSIAIDLPVPHYRLLDEGPRRSIYHSNRAAAYFARAAAGGGNEGETDDKGHLEGRELGQSEEATELNLRAAQMDCNTAIDLDAGNVKARFRLAQCLQKRGDSETAMAAVLDALPRTPPAMRPQLEELRRSLLPCTDEEDGLEEMD